MSTGKALEQRDKASLVEASRNPGFRAAGLGP